MNKHIITGMKGRHSPELYAYPRRLPVLMSHSHRLLYTHRKLRGQSEGRKMVQIYSIDEHGQFETLERIYCKNEHKELQSALENNFDLLPGDQISPDNTCKWFLIRSEMPVPDPSSGKDRWAIDFLFADQKAIPTFVECKRFGDTDSRRKVVGQMMDYAANGHHYWTMNELMDYAEGSSKIRGNTIEEDLKRIQWRTPDEPETYFQTIEENLREGQLRLVFFLEEAPNELKSIVKFLNSQMERTEVLIVEARQYQIETGRIIAPSLFGYTEEARLIKRKVNIESSATQKWTHEMYIDQASNLLDSNGINTIGDLLTECERLDCELTLGVGKMGSYSFRWPALSKTNLFNVKTDGRLEVNFGALNKSEEEKLVRDRLMRIMTDSMDLTVPADYQVRFPGFKIDEWGHKVPTFLAGLKALIHE